MYSDVPPQPFRLVIFLGNVYTNVMNIRYDWLKSEKYVYFLLDFITVKNWRSRLCCLIERRKIKGTFALSLQISAWYFVIN